MAEAKQKKKTAKKARKSVKTQLEKPILPYLLIGLAITLVIIIAIEVDSYLERNSTEEVDTTCDFCKDATAPISSKDKLKDFNEVHLRHAKKNGLKQPIKTNADFENAIDSLQKNGTLVEITDSKYYYIPRLTHSKPYLTPEAAYLLQEIGMRFHEKLREHDLPKYKFEVASLLRTEESQKQLRKVNRQATQNSSSHFYGCSFDISYSRYERFGKCYREQKLENLLTETLRELRRDCRLLIVNEKRNKCYHITVVKCKNS